MRRALVIRNPIAGRGRTRRTWPEVERALRAAGFEFDAAATVAPGHAASLAETAAQKYGSVIAVGGDGTLHEVANGLLRASGGGETIALGVVPLGSGDDFAKMLPPQAPVGGRPMSWQAAVAAIMAGRTQALDAGRLQAGTATHYFANGMDIGFGARGAANAAAMPQMMKGTACYLGALARTLVDYANPSVRLSIDDAPPRALETTMTAVMNGRCFGGSFWVCPEARADDGLFEVMVAGALGRLAILGLVPKIMRGAHTGDARIHMLRAKRVLFESDEPLAVEADGELPFPSARRVEITVLPGVLRVFG
jgi:YegS/Rv2252/BmrU family lipid kinase